MLLILFEVTMIMVNNEFLSEERRVGRPSEGGGGGGGGGRGEEGTVSP